MDDSTLFESASSSSSSCGSSPDSTPTKEYKKSEKESLKTMKTSMKKYKLCIAGAYTDIGKFYTNVAKDDGKSRAINERIDESSAEILRMQECGNKINFCLKEVKNMKK